MQLKKLTQLFENNRQWATQITQSNPEFFKKLAEQQSPEYLWIGCSDSRVPANEIVGLLPGELFVHRNVANLVIHSDMNCLSVIQYAVEVLQVKHIIVCGHYGCGGIRAAIENSPHGLLSNWLSHVRDTYRRRSDKIMYTTDANQRLDRLCELNVIEQVVNVCNTTIVQSAWNKRQQLSIHGWIYGILDGLLNDLGICISSTAELQELEHNMVGSWPMG